MLAAPGGHRDPDYLVRELVDRAVTTVHFVPSMLSLFLEADGLERMSSLRRILCSGEALPRELAERCRARLPQATLDNLYGPTEAAVDVSALSFDGSGSGATVPIGRPVFNTRLYVLDAARQPLPIGVPGELYLGGVQLARGYLNRPELTAERFVPDHLHQDGGRLYRTGDLARWLPDGTVEYLGRLDHQVKLRGYRIELGEIESALAQHPQVREAVVLLREDTPMERRLVAYLVAVDADAAPRSDALRAYLQDRLPEYLVPAVFVPLQAMPLSPNGKLDRKALAAPDRERPQLAAVYAPPRTAIEAQLASVWQEVLRVDQVGIHDNFFSLGGTSLLAAQLANRVRSLCDVDLPVLLYTTSGTTMGPKLVAHSQRTLATHAASVAEALQLSPQERPHGRVVAEGAKGVPHAALQVGVQAADDVGNVWRDDEPVSPHLPTPLPRRSERLAKDLLEGEALAAGREIPPAAPDLPHERRIAQHVEGRLETLVLREVHQHRSRLAFARHHDLFLTLLDAGQQLREVRLHLGDWQGASHAARLHVDQNSGRRVSRLCTPIKSRSITKRSPPCRTAPTTSENLRLASATLTVFAIGRSS